MIRPDDLEPEEHAKDRAEQAQTEDGAATWEPLSFKSDYLPTDEELKWLAKTNELVARAIEKEWQNLGQFGTTHPAFKSLNDAMNIEQKLWDRARANPPTHFSGITQTVVAETHPKPMSMRERIARRLAGVQFDRDVTLSANLRDDYIGAVWAAFLQEADATLDELTDASDAIIDAGMNVGSVPACFGEVEAHWKAMIQAAKEGK